MFPGVKYENPDQYVQQAKSSRRSIARWLETSLLLDGFWFGIWSLTWAFLSKKHPIGFWGTYFIGIIIISILRYLLRMS